MPESPLSQRKEFREMKLPELETAENTFPDKEFTVRLESRELNSICPWSDFPDFGEMMFWYIPDKVLLEEKSLKIYINSFRNLHVFKEDVTARILNDIVEATKPKWAKIVVDWYPRGGIPSVVGLEYDGVIISGIKDL